MAQKSSCLYLKILNSYKILSTFKGLTYACDSIVGNKALWGLDVRYLTLASKLHSQKRYEKPGTKIVKVVTEEGVSEVKKKVYVPRITLLSNDCSMKIITLDEAEKLAKRRNMKLLKVSDLDPKTNRPIYKLGAPGSGGETEKSHNDKTEKSLSINSHITDHDLQPKIKSILKWVEKNIHVRIIISGDNAAAEKVFTSISNGIQTGANIVQKVVKPGVVKFRVLPPKINKANEGKDVTPNRPTGEATT